jgi:hypothetical protein
MTPEEYAKHKLDYINARYGTGHGDDYLAVLVQECQRENEFMEATAMNKATIPDSGTRTKFPSGAVRDISEGKGRCDLLPIWVVADFLDSPFLKNVGQFQQTGEVECLRGALGHIALSAQMTRENLILLIAKRFEDGATKYGERNWEKGIPVNRYIDSAVRHYLKWRLGHTDEEHFSAVGWNILCCIWTAQNMPELNEYAKGVQK